MGHGGTPSPPAGTSWWLGLHPPLALSTALTARMRSRALGSVYSTNTSSSFSAIFTTRRNWDKGWQLGWWQGAASAMLGHCRVAVPMAQGWGLCLGAKDQPAAVMLMAKGHWEGTRSGTFSYSSSVPRSTVTSGRGALETLSDFQMGGSRTKHTQRYQGTEPKGKGWGKYPKGWCEGTATSREGWGAVVGTKTAGAYWASRQRVQPLDSLIVVDDTLHPIHKEHDLAQGCKAESGQGHGTAGRVAAGRG